MAACKQQRSIFLPKTAFFKQQEVNPGILFFMWDSKKYKWNGFLFGPFLLYSDWNNCPNSGVSWCCDYCTRLSCFICWRRKGDGFYKLSAAIGGATNKAINTVHYCPDVHHGLASAYRVHSKWYLMEEIHLGVRTLTQTTLWHGGMLLVCFFFLLFGGYCFIYASVVLRRHQKQPHIWCEFKKTIKHTFLQMSFHSVSGFSGQHESVCSFDPFFSFFTYCT